MRFVGLRLGYSPETYPPRKQKQDSRAYVPSREDK